MADSPEIDRDTRIERCPVVQTNVRWPEPVDKRLDELLDELSEVSAGDITRSRLLAALVATTPSSGSKLEQLVKQYRALTAGEVVLQETGPITLRDRRPGRRARGA